MTFLFDWLWPRRKVLSSALIAACGAAFCVSEAECEEAVIDLLVVYTASYEDWAAGGADGVESWAQASVVSANEAFSDSGAQLRLRLRAVRGVDYRHDSEDLGSELDLLTRGVGAFSQVAGWRDEVGADLVCLFEAPYAQFQETVGQAWVLRNSGGEPSKGYSILVGDYALSGLLLQHEVGHNLGAAHERTDEASSGLYSYSHAHVFQPIDAPSLTIKTVMNSRSGESINQFSNPTKSYFGSPIGVNAADNARTLRSVAKTVSNYRPYVHPEPIADAGLDFFVEDGNGDGRASVALDGGESWALDGVVEWNWSWAGGSASGEAVDIDLPIGKTIITLEVVDGAGVRNLDTIEVEVFKLSAAVSVGSTESRTFVVKESGVVKAMGGDSLRSLGLEERGRSEWNVGYVQLRDVAAVESGGTHTLFLRKDGSVFGATSRSFSGVPGVPQYSVSKPIELFGGGVRDVAVGTSTYLFVRSDGTLHVAGDSSYRLGDLSRFDRDIAAVDVDGNSALILLENGSLWCSGEIAMHANNGILEGSSPVRLFESGVVSMAISDYYGAAIMEDGSLWSFAQSDILAVDPVTRAALDFTPSEEIESGVRSVSVRYYGYAATMQNGALQVKGWTHSELLGQYHDDESANDRVELVRRHVVSASLSGHSLIIVGEDGSAWGIGGGKFSGLESTGSEYVGQFLRLGYPAREMEVIPPEANAGRDIFYPNKGSRFSVFNLDGSRSKTDWIVADWVWGNGSRERLGMSVRESFVSGAYLYTLRIMDVNGNVSEDTVDIVIDSRADFYAWLASYFPGKDFSETSDLYSIDLDGDGFTNFEERQLQQDPSRFDLGVIKSFSFDQGVVEVLLRDDLSPNELRGEISLDLLRWEEIPALEDDSLGRIKYPFTDMNRFFLRVKPR